MKLCKFGVFKDSIMFEGIIKLYSLDMDYNLEELTEYVPGLYDECDVLGVEVYPLNKKDDNVEFGKTDLCMCIYLDDFDVDKALTQYSNEITDVEVE